jgi:hypothetical protein
MTGRPMKALLIVGIGCAMGLATNTSAAEQIAVRSSAFQSGGMLPAQFTCQGANHNPPLHIQSIPKGAKSLALIVEDPDAPGGLFTHWLVWNIDPTTTEIGEKGLPQHAVQGTNDFDKVGYSGPCPPSGTHRYYFRIFALDQVITLKPGAKRGALDRALEGHIISRGELMARFSH